MIKCVSLMMYVALGVILYIGIKHPDIVRGVATPLSFGG
ncbi:hypothetical protein J2X82_005324 [Priestia megaterium]|nr:hypothetical protein [Priestia megaterium]